MTPQNWVETICLVSGICCQLVFFFLVVKKALAPQQGPAQLVNEARQSLIKANALSVSIDQATALITALSNLAANLAKAGPEVICIIAAIFFFMIAGVESGAIVNTTAGLPEVHASGDTSSSASAEMSSPSSTASDASSAAPGHHHKHKS